MQPVWCKKFPDGPGCDEENIPKWLTSDGNTFEWCNTNSFFPGCSGLSSRIKSISWNRGIQASMSRNQSEECRSFLLNPNLRHSPDVVFKCRRLKEELDALPREQRCLKYKDLGISNAWTEQNCTSLIEPMERAICNVARKTLDKRLVSQCNTILKRKGQPAIEEEASSAAEPVDIRYDDTEPITKNIKKTSPSPPKAAMAAAVPYEETPKKTFSSMSFIFLSILVALVTIIFLRRRGL